MNLKAPPPPVRILVAPLDWGLGHATRCIPLIHQLIHLGCHVILAGDGRIKTLLKKEFPNLLFLDLPGYHIQYPGTKWKMPFKIAAQIPQILQSIKEEHLWLEKAAQEHQINGIISDNRYGLFHTSLPSAFITHQLRIRTPFGKTGADILQELNYSYINKFSCCWIPDHEGEENLSGQLSHPLKRPTVPVYYTGPLSRFHFKQAAPGNHVLVILSGPEPQRTRLERILIEEIRSYKKKIIVVRGLPGENSEMEYPSHAEVYNHLPAGQLEEKMASATYVIGRCGYSTIMDLAILRKKSILIPTPGQTEQEYLGEHMMENNFALVVDQNKFRLKQALDLADVFSYRPMPAEDLAQRNNVLSEFIMMTEANKSKEGSN